MRINEINTSGYYWVKMPCYKTAFVCEVQLMLNGMSVALPYPDELTRISHEEFADYADWQFVGPIEYPF